MIVSPVAMLVSTRNFLSITFLRSKRGAIKIATGLTIMDFETMLRHLEIHDCQPGGDAGQHQELLVDNFLALEARRDQDRHRADNHGFRDNAASSRNP